MYLIIQLIIYFFLSDAVSTTYNENTGVMTQVAFSGHEGNSVFVSGNMFLATAIELLLPQTQFHGTITTMRVKRKFHDEVAIDLRVSKEMDGTDQANTKNGYIDIDSMAPGSIVILRHPDTTKAHMNNDPTTCAICADCTGILDADARSVYIFAIDSLELFRDFMEINIWYDNGSNQKRLATYSTALPGSNANSLIYPNGAIEFHAALDLDILEDVVIPTYKDIMLSNSNAWGLPLIRHFGRCSRYKDISNDEHSFSITSITSKRTTKSLYDKKIYWQISLSTSYVKNQTDSINDTYVMVKWLPQDPNEGGAFLHILGDATNNKIFKLTPTGTCANDTKYSKILCTFEPIVLELHAPSYDKDLDTYLEDGAILPRIVIAEAQYINKDKRFSEDTLMAEYGRESSVAVIDAIDFPFRFGQYKLNTLSKGPCVDPWARAPDSDNSNNEPVECDLRRNILSQYEFTEHSSATRAGHAAAFCDYCNVDKCCCSRLNDLYKGEVCNFIYKEGNLSCQSSINDCAHCLDEECCSFMSQSLNNPLYCFMDAGVCKKAPDQCSDCANETCCMSKIGECYFSDTCKELPSVCELIETETDCAIMSTELGCKWTSNTCVSDVTDCTGCNSMMYPLGCCMSTPDNVNCTYYQNTCIDIPTTCDDCNTDDNTYSEACCSYAGGQCGFTEGTCKGTPDTCQACMGADSPNDCCLLAWDSMWCQWIADQCLPDMGKECGECNYALNPKGCCNSRNYCHYYVESDPKNDNVPLGICSTVTTSCEECNMSPFVAECCSIAPGCNMLGFACHVEEFDPPDVCGNTNSIAAGVGFAAASIGLLLVLTMMFMHWLTYDTKIKKKRYGDSMPEPELNMDFYYADAEMKPLPLDEDERGLLEATDAGTAGGISATSEYVTRSSNNSK